MSVVIQGEFVGFQVSLDSPSGLLLFSKGKAVEIFLAFISSRD